MRGPRRRGPAPVADLVAALMDPILARKAGMTTGLIAAWPEIAGARLAGSTQPEKLHWPARRGPDEPLEPATLVIACETAATLRLQHEADELLGRVNVFLGQGSVKRIRIVQKSVTRTLPDRRPKSRPLTEDDRERVAAMVARIEDPALKGALEAFAASILARSRD